MKVAIASLLQESNTFSPVFTRYADFAPVFGAAAAERHRGKLTEMGGFLDVLTEGGEHVEPLMAGWAITANRLRRADYARLVGEFEKRLRRARPDGLLFALHGAQTAEGEDDVAGDLLARARAILGGAPIMATLDLHANITRRMAASADALVGYHTYPHVDMFEIGQKAARLLLRTLRGEVRPAMAFHKLPLIVNAENSQTHRGPLHRLMRSAEQLERSGAAEAVSLFPVQPWMDIAEMGCAVVSVTNGDSAAATRQCRTLARRWWHGREEFAVELVSPEEAIERALAAEGGPVVLAESSDSTGSGSPGDSTGVLKHLLQAPLTGTAAIFLVDPAAVARAVKAGVGRTVRMKLGGAFDRRNSRPVAMTARVRLLSDGRWTARARGYNTGIVTEMGRAAVLEAGHVSILVAERSAMTVDPELFRSHGIEPLHCQIVVVKSPNGFRACYEPIAKAIYLVDTPGVSTANLRSLPWRRVPRPIYPLDPLEDFTP